MYSQNIIKLLIVLILAVVLGTLFTRGIIPVLRKKQMGQNIREEGPEAHKAKAGTPSMGGVAIAGAVTLSAVFGYLLCSKFGKWVSVVNEESVIHLILILAGFLLFGFLGFIDDYLKVIKKENEGFKVLPKFICQMVIAVALAVFMAYGTPSGTEVYIPIYGQHVDFGGLFIPFAVFTILAMVNAVNFTDGLDGLASSVTIVVALTLCIISLNVVEPGSMATCVFSAALIGGLVGFLVYNHHPARIFMGDTGSMALGGGITMAAFAFKAELFLPVIGIIYLLEVLSVCMQVTYFKATHGKRIFRMTPLHHHFELGGMSENGVVGMFCAITAVCCIIAVLIG